MKKSTTILAGFILLFATSAFTLKNDGTLTSSDKNETKATPIEERSQAIASPGSLLVDEDNVFTKVEIDASYTAKGGWTEYIKNAIESNVEELLEEGSSVTCKLSFVVGKDGTVKDVKALTMQDSKLAEIVIAALKNAPKWVPAQQNGINVQCKRVQDVSFLIK